MLLRRARPTIRVLRDDLGSGWDDPGPRRALLEGNLRALHPLGELPHPIIAKARDCFGDDPTDDHHAGTIASARSLKLLEVKAGQWRGGVWVSEDGICWLVAAGLAKGDHEDRDDFYQQLARHEDQGNLGALVPEQVDLQLWKREVAAARLAAWELSVQTLVMDELESIHAGGQSTIEVLHPFDHVLPEHDQLLADVEIHINPVREADYESDDVVVTVSTPDRWAGTDLVWTLTTRVLITLSPPEQGWDRLGDTFSNIAEPGSFGARYSNLKALTSDGQLAESELGAHAHRIHKRDLMERTVDGRAVRALCGAFFVPRQDHESLSECETCKRRLDEIESASAT